MKILNQLLTQFRQRHRREPVQIVVDPEAAVAIASRRSLAPIWNGIPVVCRKVADLKVSADPKRLLVFVDRAGGKSTLRASDG